MTELERMEQQLQERLRQVQQQRADAQDATTRADRAWVAAVEERLRNRSLHGTAVAEVALVVRAVLDVLGVHYDPPQPPKSTDAA